MSSKEIPRGLLSQTDPTNYNGTGWTKAQWDEIQQTGKMPKGPLAANDPNNYKGTGWTKDQLKAIAQNDSNYQYAVNEVPKNENAFAKKVAGTMGALYLGGALGGAGAAGAATGGTDDPSSDNPGGGGSNSFLDWLGSLGGFVKDYGQTALGAIGAINQGQRIAKSDEYAKKALDFVHNDQGTGVYDLNAPLRNAGRSGLLNPTANAPDLSNLKSIATTGSGNPFAGAPMPLYKGPSSSPPPPAAPSAAPMPLAPRAPTPPIQNPDQHTMPALSLEQAPTTQLISQKPNAPAQTPLGLTPQRPMVKPVTAPLALS